MAKNKDTEEKDVKEEEVKEEKPSEEMTEEKPSDEEVAEELPEGEVMEGEEVPEGEEGIGREFAFPTAPIVRIMKEELDDYKMIRSRVKIEMNQWLENLCRRVTRSMNRSDYTMVEVSDLRTAIEPYERIGDIEVEKERIVATMEKIKMDCDSLIRDVDRKFIAPDPKRRRRLEEIKKMSGAEEVEATDEEPTEEAARSPEAARALKGAIKSPEGGETPAEADRSPEGEAPQE